MCFKYIIREYCNTAQTNTAMNIDCLIPINVYSSKSTKMTIDIKVIINTGIKFIVCPIIKLRSCITRHANIPTGSRDAIAERAVFCM